MRFTVPLASAPSDLAALAGEITRDDPAALVDFDADERSLRLATSLEPGDIALALTRAGLPMEPVNVYRMPSECCGGCGG